MMFLAIDQFEWKDIRCQVLHQAVLGLGGDDDALETVGNGDVLDDEDSSETFTMMDEHGKDVTVGVTILESWLMNSLMQNGAECSCNNFICVELAQELPSS